MSQAQPPPRRAVAVARLLVVGQFALLLALVLVPGRPATGSWPALAGLVAIAVGVVIAGFGATALGRGLTAVPLPNRHAVLRTGGLYRWVRHPIYAGLLLAAAGLTLRAATWLHVLLFLALLVLLNGKARFEERFLTARFPGYQSYAARTPRFVPGLRGVSRRRFPRS